MDTVNLPLEQRPEALDRVGVRLCAIRELLNVFASGVRETCSRTKLLRVAPSTLLIVGACEAGVSKDASTPIQSDQMF
jgi:hypothetical protein